MHLARNLAARDQVTTEEYLTIVASALAVKQKASQAVRRGDPKIAKAIAAGTGSIFSKIDKNGNKVLTYYGLMFAGAMARTCAATAVHPLNVCKTMLQTKGGVMPDLKWSVLSRGAGSQFIMSIPHGAINFVVTEVRAPTLNRHFSRASPLKTSPTPKHSIPPENK